MTTTSRNPYLLARLALGAAVLLAAGACSDDSESPSADPTPSETASAPASPTPTSTPPPTPTEEPTPAPEPTEEPTPEPAPELIPYAGGESAGVEIQKPGDVKNLKGAPASFKRFIRTAVTELQEQSTCGDGFVGITVQFLRTDGYATGGVNDCGGYLALWATVDGDWKEIAGTQELWDCAVLEQYTVPSDIAGDSCYDEDAQQQQDYQQA